MKVQENITLIELRNSGPLQIAAHTRLLGRHSWSLDRPVRIGDVATVYSCAVAGPEGCRQFDNRQLRKKP